MDRMKTSPSPSSRFWVIAPFMGLLILTLIYLGFWRYLSRDIPARLAEAGLSYRAIEASGFPTRLTFDIQNIAYADPSISWQSEALRLDLMPYSDEQAVLRFTKPHLVATSLGKITIDHSTNIASLKLGLDGPQQFDFVLTSPDISGYLGTVQVKALSQDMEAHVRRNPQDQSRADLVATAQLLQLGRLDIFDTALMKAEMPAQWFLGQAQWVSGLRAGETLDIKEITLKRDQFELTARGSLGADQNGKLAGEMTIDLTDLTEFTEMLLRYGVIDRRMHRDILLLNGFTSFFGQRSAGQKISVPVKFSGGRTTIANVPVGSAPRLPLP